MFKEVWKDVPDYEGYYKISNFGNVYSIKSNLLLKQSKLNKGYHEVKLQKNGFKQNFRVHRLVATMFISNPLGLSEVNHIDENKSNNCADNLEWVTRKQNVNHGTRNERASHSLKESNKRPILAIFKNGVTTEYSSANECARILGLSAGNINSVIRGARNHTHGIRFKAL